MASPYIQASTPVQLLDCSKAWSLLTTQEKLYAYYFVRASNEGSKVCFFQRSVESPGLFLLFQELFKQPNLKERVLEAGLLEEDWNRFKAYAAGIYNNAGNYRSFGDSKILPELSREKFETVINLCNNEKIDRIWGKIADLVFDESPATASLGFRDEGGVSSYYSQNITKSDALLVKNFLTSKNLTDLHVNSRLWKTSDYFEVKVASESGHHLPYAGEYDFENTKIRITNGDYSCFMGRIVQNLTRALPYAANGTQEAMLINYIKHFLNGDINYHKDSQREWIKDKGPVVETNIGFIETYADPLNIRAEFEGFVSIVDKEISEKFSSLVNNAEKILPKLPWGPAFEKDKFQSPDFTSLDIVTFASSGVPIGINIPNYDDIRTKEGFKNVNLGNAYPKITKTTLQFLSEDDSNLISEMYSSAETVAVALHELLGHGSGKLLLQNNDGSFNFDVNTVNPATGEKIDSFYKPGETWSSIFAELSGAYEECRAETIAVYLSFFREPFEIFGIQEFEKARNMVWLYMVYAGVKGMIVYNPDANRWGQAHCWARYVIFRVMREAGGDFLTIEFTEDEQFLIHMDFNKIESHGFPAVRDFLNKLHCFKSTGDIVRGRALFNHFSKFDEEAKKIRQIIIANQKPRRLVVQGNLLLDNGVPHIKNYEENFDGVIQSFLERFPQEDVEMLEFWERDFELSRGN
jgi:dipeptidyl-peptidase-3